MSNFIKFHPVGDEFFHADRQDGLTDMMKLVVAYRNFTNAPTVHSVRIKYTCVRLILLVHKVTIRILIIKPTRCTNFSNLFL
jgi:hypothetical protein